MRILIALALLLLSMMAYVRLAPTDASLWHEKPDFSAAGETLSSGGFLAVRRMAAPAVEVLSAIEQTALATDRTKLISGNVAEAMMTFQTRSLIWGFPDHTTVAVDGDLIAIHGRLRFGSADLGVNKARVLAWLDALGPLTEPL